MQQHKKAQHHTERDGTTKVQVCALCAKPLGEEEWQVEFTETGRRKIICPACAGPIMSFLASHKLLE
ncbi:MAG: hypothetical protein KGJ93_00755 [Patescibacteria group bacterium]|nr:hypothetical protein [Patescibacteria group bacterium]